LVLLVRPGLPPAHVVGNLALLVLVVTFLLVAVGVVTIFSVALFQQRFDPADAWDNLPRLAGAPPHLVLATGSLLMLLAVGVLGAAWLAAYGLLLRPIHLEITRDGWLLRRHGSREAWRLETHRVSAVEHRRGMVVLRVAGGRSRKLRGWDDDMAALAASLRWAMEAVAVPAASDDPGTQP
jgi:hypothetical protein